MQKTKRQQNRNLVDYAEYYDLVYGTENKNTELNQSLRKKVLESLFELHSEDFPNNRRAVKEAILHGQEIRDYSETQYVVKDRFVFAQQLYKKFKNDVVEGKFIADFGYGFNAGAILNSPEQSQDEFLRAWDILKEENLEKKFFHRMAKRKIEEFLFTAPGQKEKSPNQAWMDLFGLNESVCSSLRTWFYENLLLIYKNTSNKRIREIFGDRVKDLSDKELKELKANTHIFWDRVYGPDYQTVMSS
jgi:hypothetical protein